MDSSAPIGSDSLPPLPPQKAPLPTVVRAAGVAMVIMALLNFILTAMMPNDLPGSKSSGLFDLILGLMLASGNRSALNFTRFRAWLGLLIGVPLMAGLGGWPDALGQGLWCLSLIALLAENPGKPRVILGSLLILSGMGMAALGAVALKVGPGVIAYYGQTEPLPPDRVVKTSNSKLQLHVRGEGWELMKPAEVKKTNSLFDFWIVHPQADLHLAVIPETIDEPLEMKDLRDAVVSNLGSQPVSEEDHRLGKLLRFHGKVEDIDLERFVLLIVRPKEIYQIHVWCASSNFSGREKEFRELLDSVQVQ